eukprot:3326993-Alexandrium_andersonii.AAC.1
MVRGQSNRRPVRPVWEDGFDLSLAQGPQDQGAKLPCNADESDNAMPAASQPGRTATLVAVAGSQGQGPKSTH